MIELLERLIGPAASEENKPDLTPEFYFDEAAFEAEFNTPEEQESLIVSVSMRRAIGVVAAGVLVAGGVGYKAGQPHEPELEVSAQQITDDLNSGDRTTKPVIIEQGSELIIPKEDKKDKEISVVNPIRLSDDRYGALVFDNKGKAKVVEVPASEATLEPTKTDGKETESHEIVYPVSVVYTEVPTKSGKAERIYSAVAGDDSGNAANGVQIDTDNATPDQKRLLQDKTLRKLVRNAVSLAANDRVGYLEIAS